MKPIEKASFEATMREIRKLYRRHEKGEINASTFAGQSNRLLNQLKWSHVRSLAQDTATQVIREIESYQRQFGLSLTLEHSLYYSRGVKASITLKQDNRVYGEIFIGPKFHWDLICVQPTDKNYGLFGPNMYTKRMSKHWKQVESFDYPTYLQQLKEHIEECEARHREEEARVARGEPRYPDEIPF